MNSDLQHLIELQDLELAAERLRHRISDIPNTQAALDARVEERNSAVAAVKERSNANAAARREIEKELAVVQGRLSKFKDQLMAVKTNKEYQAMQHEIATAEQGVRDHEDRLLERMEETDALTAELKAATTALSAEQGEVAKARVSLDLERSSWERELQELDTRRAAVSGQLSPAALKLFEHVARHRKGVALSEAREGHCTQCHVRLRPQVFNEVRRNDSLHQCESCSRILYYVAAPAPTSAPQPS
jgi:predicted  nucleic acid-binding Zn-ribbon protein